MSKDSIVDHVFAVRVNSIIFARMHPLHNVQKYLRHPQMKVGACLSKESCKFAVWAPHRDNVSLVLCEENQVLKMSRVADGFWWLELNGITPESQYMYRLGDKVDRADPASHFQPEGVFGASAVVDHGSFGWSDQDWLGIAQKDLVIYELHVGTFSKEGTFAAARERAHALAELGITAVELMPIAQFPGTRNWGYDSVFPYAVQNTYGGPLELKLLVDEFHRQGVAVILDVVYNHLGPEGNFLGDFGPYFLSERQTPWGPALNFDGLQSRYVRDYFIESALYWFRNYHVDGLRLDAVYAIVDRSRRHFLQELSDSVQRLPAPRMRLLIAENDRVDPKMTDVARRGGYGLDAVWHDSLHHALHTLLTGEKNWYYASFGSIAQVVQAFKEGGEECASQKACVAPWKQVAFSQNHDQIGNRPLGERLTTLAGLEAAKVAAACVILSHETPLLFMGEEYGETSPFLFFTDYKGAELAKVVLVNRRKEALQNGWRKKPLDSQSLDVFVRSKIDWEKKATEKGAKTLGYYKALLSLRKNLDKAGACGQFGIDGKRALVIHRHKGCSVAFFFVNFGSQSHKFNFPASDGEFVNRLDSADSAWAGPGSELPTNARSGDVLHAEPTSFAVYVNSKFGEGRRT